MVRADQAPERIARGELFQRDIAMEHKGGGGLVLARGLNERVIVYYDGKRIAEVGVNRIKSKEVRLKLIGDRKRVQFFREEIAPSTIAEVAS